MRCCVPRAVRFQEVDAAGIVFFARLFDYASDALFAAFEAGGIDLSRMFEAPDVVTPVKRAAALYVAPLRFGDAVEIVAVAARIEETQYALGWRVERVEHSTPEPTRVPAAVVEVAHVAVDPATFRRTALPERYAAALRALV